MNGGNHLRVAQSDARAGGAAGGEGPERFRKLVAAVNHVVPRREPHGDALAHGVRDAEDVSAYERRDDQRQTDGGNEDAAARDAV